MLLVHLTVSIFYMFVINLQNQEHLYTPFITLAMAHRQKRLV